MAASCPGDDSASVRIAEIEKKLADGNALVSSFAERVQLDTQRLLQEFKESTTKSIKESKLEAMHDLTNNLTEKLITLVRDADTIQRKRAAALEERIAELEMLLQATPALSCDADCINLESLPLSDTDCINLESSPLGDTGCIYLESSPLWAARPLGPDRRLADDATTSYFDDLAEACSGSTFATEFCPYLQNWEPLVNKEASSRMQAPKYTKSPDTFLVKLGPPPPTPLPEMGRYANPTGSSSICTYTSCAHSSYEPPLSDTSEHDSGCNSDSELDTDMLLEQVKLTSLRLGPPPPTPLPKCMPTTSAHRSNEHFISRYVCDLDPDSEPEAAMPYGKVNWNI